MHVHSESNITIDCVKLDYYFNCNCITSEGKSRDERLTTRKENMSPRLSTCTKHEEQLLKTFERNFTGTYTFVDNLQL